MCLMRLSSKFIHPSSSPTIRFAQLEVCNPNGAEGEERGECAEDVGWDIVLVGG